MKLHKPMWKEKIDGVFTNCCRDEVAEWLMRWTANPLGSARVGSNPILVEVFFFINCSLYTPFNYIFLEYILLPNLFLTFSLSVFVMGYLK